jgi:peptide/nickel transport system ATP-binding protein
MVRREPPKVCSPPLADIQRETSPAVAVPGGRVIRLDRVSVRYGRGAHAIAAAEDISFAVEPGEAFGLVGESGSGKSTVLRAIAGLIAHAEGLVELGGAAMPQRRSRAQRRLVQMVFQDPYGSLHPRQTVDRALSEPLLVHGIGDIEARILRALAEVALAPSVRFRYPHELSGGQRQRVAIARAIAAHPRIIVCDEPVSALDVSIQAQILDLLGDLQRQFGMSYLFISHDLGVIHHVSDRVLVMRQGEVVESGDADEILLRPQSRYAQGLVAAVPRLRFNEGIGQ